MAKWLILTSLTAAVAAFAPLPAGAQSQNGVLVIYGTDVCPTDANGNEIVVCTRRPESERYRIPKELRDIKPENQSWATKVDDVRDAGRTGVGSCSAVGAGGFTGCLADTINRAKAESRARRDADDSAGR
ncbi:hypothetical protein KY084_13690 [Stakelama sp. CBK3Z-3]|uniref:Uncharacterized protein n=1 Tax=Stakelama flava TaxID=2860338 RepID=A0ABS6XR85_9SPHN|nr:hypothetical protein [Stakelama flava]MBW4331920.1 hypothetical protein [Stakelama flava]